MTKDEKAVIADFASTLRVLLEKATPGKWEFHPLHWGAADVTHPIGEGEKWDGNLILNGHRQSYVVKEGKWYDATLIAYLRNHAEALLAVVEAANRCSYSHGHELSKALRKLEDET